MSNAPTTENLLNKKQQQQQTKLKRKEKKKLRYKAGKTYQPLVRMDFVYS